MLLPVRQYRQKVSPLWIVSGSSLVWGLEPFGVSTFQGFRVSDWEGSEIQSQTFARTQGDLKLNLATRQALRPSARLTLPAKASLAKVVWYS